MEIGLTSLKHSILLDELPFRRKPTKTEHFIFSLRLKSNDLLAWNVIYTRGMYRSGGCSGCRAAVMYTRSLSLEGLLTISIAGFTIMLSTVGLVGFAALN